MFAAELTDKTVWQPVLLHPVIRESLAWLEKYAATAEFGNHPLSKPDWYAYVHEYATLNESECVWENHIQTIDIQYLVHGSEAIRWTNVQQLGTPARYVEDQDRQEFNATGVGSSTLIMRPGTFAIFLPGEAHCPKIALGEPEQLRKVVVKIPVQLIENILPCLC